MSGKKEKLKKSKPAENCTFLPPRVSDDGAVRLPAVKLIYLPFGIMVDKFVLLLKLGSFYALLLSLVSFVFGYAYICVISPVPWGAVFCRVIFCLNMFCCWALP